MGGRLMSQLMVSGAADGFELRSVEMRRERSSAREGAWDRAARSRSVSHRASGVGVLCWFIYMPSRKRSTTRLRNLGEREAK